VIIAQFALVYTFAGIAKLNYDWLFRAMPLAVWLPEHTDMPVLGCLFGISWMPFAFSWIGAIYDLTIAYFLMWRVTRPYAYLVVIVFHTMTHLLFNIGLFPLIMTLGTLVFFSGAWHRRAWELTPLRLWLRRPSLKKRGAQMKKSLFAVGNPPLSWEERGPGGELKRADFKRKLLTAIIATYFLLQLALPFRYLLYPGNLFWTEEGYRFSWRVMLLEKAGHATFYVEDRESGRKAEVINSDYLTSFQEKQMAIQPDFILQYAHFLAEEYAEKYELQDPIVRADVFVALNGKASERYIDPEADLTRIQDSFRPKKWLLSRAKDEVQSYSTK
jgi:hypothetical protein